MELFRPLHALERVPLLGHPACILAVSAGCGSLAVAAPFPSLVCFLGWLLAWARDRRLLAVAAVVFFVTGVRALAQVNAYEAVYHQALTELGAPRRCAGQAVVEGSVTARLSADGPWEETGQAVWLGRALSMTCEDRPLSAGIGVRFYGGPLGLARGDRVEVIGQLAPVRRFQNAALSDPTPSLARRGAVLSGSVLALEVVEEGRGLGADIDRARARVRERIVATYHPEVVGLGRALVLGENDLDPNDQEGFSKSGLMHLLAVSGTHLVIAVLSLVGALRAVLVRVFFLSARYDVARLSSALGAASSVLYAEFAGGSGSAYRAAWMLVLVLMARAFGFRLGGAAALGGSLGIMLALDPLAASDLSFVLSGLATSGLIGLGQPLTRAVTRLGEAAAQFRFLSLGPVKLLIESLVATVASTLACAPALWLMDGEMTAAALIANVVAAPFGEILALPACLLHAVSAFWPSLEGGLAQIGSGALRAVRVVALYSAQVKSLRFAVPFLNPWELSFWVVAGVSGVRFFWSHRRVPLPWPLLGARRPALLSASLVVPIFVGHTLMSAAGSAAAPAGQPGRSRALPALLGVTALDVGQGDALAVDFPAGQLGLIDGGGFAVGTVNPGDRVLLPYLRARGRSSIDLMVLSHPHPDHIQGLIRVAEELPVLELWHPAQAVRPGSTYAELIRLVKAGGGVVRGAPELCENDGQREFGGTQITVLFPCGLSPGGEPWGANDASLVLKARYGGRSVLFTGDVEERGEAALLARERARPGAFDLKADVLKVAHHGSDTSSAPELVGRVQPAIALISSGVRNRFGHPRASTLETLHAAGAQIFRTDRSGSTTVLTDGQRLWVRSFRSPFGR